MSADATNEYIISSNNSINENKYNNEKLKKSGVRGLLRPLMKLIKRTTKRAQKKQNRCCDMSYEDDQNSSNESLERKILQEIEECPPGSAFLMYTDEDSCEVVPVTPRQNFVPVHFARTEAGTFFWTSISKAYDYDFAASGHCYTECQTAEQQIPFYGYDRWVQA